MSRMPRRSSVVLPLIAIATLLVACATAPSGQLLADVRPQSIPTNKALVYVYRNHAEPTVWNATVVIGNREIASLSQRTFTWFFADPGNNALRANWPALSGQTPSTVEIEMKPNQIYYIELSGVSRVAGVMPTGTGIGYSFKLG